MIDRTCQRFCRSALYMPASNPRALAKGPTLDADAIIVDLEDSVAPVAKASAREAAVAVLRERDYGGRLRALRVNAPDTPWHADDLSAISWALPDVVVLPKVESPEAVRTLLDALGTNPATRAVHVWAMLETPLAVVRAGDIAAVAAGEHHRFDTLIVGNNDLARAAGMPIEGSRAHLLPWLMSLVAAAKAYGLRILDGVWNDFADADGFEGECAQGRAMGMDGKTLIHPAQIGIANRTWTPDAKALTEARAIVAAFEEPEAAEQGALQIDGRMVERLHLDMARRTLALAAELAPETHAGDATHRGAEAASGSAAASDLAEEAAGVPGKGSKP